MQSDLAVLDAEQFGVPGLLPFVGSGPEPPESRPPLAPATMAQQQDRRGDGPAPRKRPRLQGRKSSAGESDEQQEDDEDEEGAKRARGRPRLDTTDETPAEVSERDSQP